ncbi:MAG: hypothetical protein MUP21_03810 [Dehalococcoidia bacterium]|nr:hypothetical protein [Dehalococcoidia bacterium]
MVEERQTPGNDEMYCRSCGATIKKRAELCVHCGVRVRRDSVVKPEGAPTVKPVIGGILGIVAGAFPLIGGIVMTAIGIASSSWANAGHWALIGVGIPVFALGAAAIVGSSYAIARKNFPLAILGGVCSVFSMWMLGIPALVLIAISSKEFYAATEEA